ncbi:hypothetical protein CsatA_008917 [Cannabis sativa]
MENNNNNSLFGNVVKDTNTFFLPNPLATSLKALSNLQNTTIYISDRAMGIGDIRILKTVFLLDGRVKIEGQEWDTFVSDRGIRVGDVLLLRIIYNIPYIMNVTLFRINPQNNPILINPPKPQQNNVHHDHKDLDLNLGFEIKPFLCVKKLSVADLRSDHHQIEMPKEIGEMVMEEAEDLIEFLKGDDFGIVVRDQNIGGIQIETKLKMRDDGVVLFGQNWSQLVDLRGLKGGDVIVFYVDLCRRVIIATVYRSHQELDFFIPSQPHHLGGHT